MNTFFKFYALSAIYFGLVSPVTAQPQAAPSHPLPAQAAEEAPRDHFEHPMLEQHGGTDMRPPATEGPRIQRRGMQDTRRDGEIRRNILPGASDAGDAAPRMERERRTRDTQRPWDRRDRD